MNRALVSLFGTLAVALVGLLIACTPAPPAKPPAEQATSKPTQAAPKAEQSTPAAAQPAPAKKEAPAAPFALKIGAVPTTALGALFLAEGKGYYKEQGLSATIESVTSGPEALTNIAAGHLNVGSATGAAFFNAVARGTNVKIVGPSQSFDPKIEPTAPLIVRKDLWDSGAVRKVADLKGKRVAIPGTGTAAEFLVNEAMKSASLSVKDLELVFMPFPEMPAAFANKGIDGALAGEPFTTNLVEQGHGVKLFKDFPPGTIISVIVMGADLLKNNPDVPERFMIAYLKAARDLYGDGWRRDDNVAILAQSLKISPELVKKSIPSFVDPNGKVDLASFQRHEKFYMERGYLNYDKPLDSTVYYDEAPARKAVEKLGVFR